MRLGKYLLERECIQIWEYCWVFSLTLGGRICAGSTNPASVFGTISQASISKSLTSCSWEQMNTYWLNFWTADFFGPSLGRFRFVWMGSCTQTQLVPGTRACYHCGLWLPGIPVAASSGHIISPKEGYGPFALAFRAGSAFSGNRPLAVK